MTGTSLEHIQVGTRFRSEGRTVSETDIVSFSAITGDYSPLHANLVHIERETPFRDRLAQGWLVVAIQSGLNSELKNWKMLAYLGMERRFTAPVYPGDTIFVDYTVEEVRPSRSKPDRGVVTLKCDVVNQDEVVVCHGHETFLVASAA